MRDDKPPASAPPTRTGPVLPARPRLGLVLVTAFAAAGAVAFFFFDPQESGLFWTCPLNTITGLHCPGCGGQRALHALLHAHWGAAVSLNALAVLLVLPAAAYAYIAYACRVLGWARLPMPQIDGRHALVLAGLMLAFAVMRNLPFAPFDSLAP